MSGEVKAFVRNVHNNQKCKSCQGYILCWSHYDWTLKTLFERREKKMMKNFRKGQFYAKKAGPTTWVDFKGRLDDLF